MFTKLSFKLFQPGERTKHHLPGRGGEGVEGWCGYWAREGLGEYMMDSNSWGQLAAAQASHRGQHDI